ncbi:MAG: sarcosine oxidase subunit gamma family protein [Stackebrandtia sp.]
MADNITAPAARGPIAPAPPEIEIAGWAVSGRRSDAALTLADHTPLAKVVVRAGHDGELAVDLAVPFGRAARVDDLEALLVGVAPGEWLALGPPGEAAALVERLLRVAGERPDEPVAVVDVTHGRALLRVCGEQSANLLAAECAVDVSDRACPNGTAFRSEVCGVAADVVRDDRDQTPSYLVGCEWTHARYLFESLLDSGAELGVDVDGFTPPKSSERDKDAIPERS